MGTAYLKELWEGGGSVMTLLIYRLKTPFQYRCILQDFMYQDELFHSCKISMKDIYSQSQKVFEFILFGNVSNRLGVVGL